MSLRSPYCRLELFGGIRLVLPESVVTRFRTQKTALLLAYLACQKGHEVPRDALIEMLWPDQDLDEGRASLSASLTSLRRQLEPAGVQAGSVLQADRRTVRLNPDAFLTDVEEFETLLGQAEPGTQGARVDLKRQQDLLQKALALYQGEFLSGYYADWVTPEQSRLTQRYLDALLALARTLAQQGALPRALETARQALSTDPYQENACRLIMRLLAHLGQIPAALETYQQFRSKLQQDLLAAPSRATRALAEQIQNHPETFQSVPQRETFAVEDALPKEELTESSIASPPQPTPPPAPLPVALPLQTTRFFGREHETQQILTLLQPQTPTENYAPRRRLLTLTGPGGMGKTRLAIEAAGKLSSSFAGGVWFVPLATVPHPRLLPFAFAHALQLRAAPQADLLDQIVEKLNAAPTLLVLDNFEHLLRDQDVSKVEDFKTADATVLVRLLLERAPQVSLLVTSRRLLGLGGEQEVALAALAVPELAGSLEDLVEVGSVALYVDRAQYVLPDFAVTPRNADAIRRLCRKLEGMPLALEMAAAWVKTIPPAQMLQKLEPSLDLLVSRRRDLPPRQRSLRATIEWSYELLTPELQQMFVRLAVFRGGWTLEAAEAVCGADRSEKREERSEKNAAPLSSSLLTIHTSEVLDLLAQLQSHSLLLLSEEQEGEVRYRLLEPLQQFAAEKLEEDGQTRVMRQRHADYFVGWAETARSNLDGAERVRWLDRMEADHDNLRKVLLWFLEEPEQTEKGLQLCSTLTLFWETRGHLTEGRFWCDRMLKAEGTPLKAERTLERSLARGHTLLGASGLAIGQGDYASAQTMAEESLEIFRESEERSGISESLRYLAAVSRQQGDYALALQRLEEALAIQREIGNQFGIGRILNQLGMLAHTRGDFAISRAHFEECLATYRALENRRAVAVILQNMGNLVVAQGDYALARSLFEEALTINREIGNRPWAAMNLGGLGTVADLQGDASAAEAYIMESLTIQREVGDRQGIAVSLNNLSAVVHARGDDQLARNYYTEALAINREIGNRANEVLNLNNLGHLAHVQGEYGQAQLWYAQSLAILREIDYPKGLVKLVGHIAALFAAQVLEKRANSHTSEVSVPDSNILLQAARAWGAAEVLREQFGISLEPLRQEALAQEIASAQEQVEAQDWADAWAEGRRMTRQQILDCFSSALHSPLSETQG